EVTISATDPAGNKVSNTLTVQPLLANIVFPNGSTTGGNQATGEVQLNCSAPTPDGETITITSSDSTLVNVPDTVQVREGISFADFTLSTAVVSDLTNVTISHRATINYRIEAIAGDGFRNSNPRETCCV